MFASPPSSYEIAPTSHQRCSNSGHQCHPHCKSQRGFSASILLSSACYTGCHLLLKHCLSKAPWTTCHLVSSHILTPPFSVSTLGPSHLASKCQGPRAHILDLFSVSSHCLGWVIQPLDFNTINVENVTRICTSSSGPAPNSTHMSRCPVGIPTRMSNGRQRPDCSELCS